MGMDLLKRQLIELKLADATAFSGLEASFSDYMRLLMDWNENVNLTAITEPEEIISKHFTDSLTILAQTDIKPNAYVLDVGSGAGFPGVPIKILRPDIDLTMLDSLNKRIIFLTRLISVLGLENTRAVHFRAEDAAREQGFRESFDIVCARAVAKLAVLAELCIPFVKNGGKFISMKGFDAQSEILASEKAITAMGGRIEHVGYVDIPYTDIRRSVIIVRKISQTPPQYPRNAGKITKRPIT